MSWYLFKDSPARELRGKKVDGYQNMQQTKIIMDWGLGELSPKKQEKNTQQYSNHPQRNTKSLHEKNQPSTNKQQKIKAIQNTIKILTQSSDEQEKQQLIKVLKNYNKKHQKKQGQNINEQNRYQQNNQNIQNNNKIKNNRSGNILSDFEMEFVDSNDRRNKNGKNINNTVHQQQQGVDIQTAKRLRFLQNSLLPLHKQDNMTAILDFQLNKDVSSSLNDSRISGKSHFGNKKNQSAIELGDGFNTFVPMKQKVKDMNQRLKEMYDYDEKCRRRQVSQVSFG